MVALDGGETYGNFSYDKGTIQIAQTTNDEGQQVTVCDQAKQQAYIHEILHAIDHIFNNGVLTEEHVSRLSEGLFQVIQDNPELFTGGKNV